MHEQWPLSWQVAALVVLLVIAAFFSIAETAMMAINRYRLKHLVTQGHRSAVRVAELLKRTDRLLGGILIGNTLVIVAASSLSSFIAIRLFGEDKIVYAIGTLVISFLIIIFSEITPKVIGATYPERTALLLSYPLKATLRLLVPAAWFVNLFVRPLLWLLRIPTEPNMDTPKLSAEEIRTLVLESSSFMPKKHLSILLNLFDVGAVTVQDIMVEIIGKFTTWLPSAAPMLAWDEQGSATAEGAMPVRDINRALGLNLPTDGPKTLNGLIVEYLQDIPEADVAVKIGSVPMEIVHAQGRTVKTVRIFRPVEPVENAEPSEA